MTRLSRKTFARYVMLPEGSIRLVTDVSAAQRHGRLALDPRRREEDHHAREPARDLLALDQENEVEPGDLYPGADICSADLREYVTVVELPDGVSPAPPLTARFDGHKMTIEPAGA